MKDRILKRDEKKTNYQHRQQNKNQLKFRKFA